MLVLAMFVLMVVILDAVAIGICMLIERSSEFASLLAFLAFFVVNFVFAWQLALRITERYLISDAQRRANEEHTRWVNSRFAGVRRWQ
jgi:hypothetical protein